MKATVADHVTRRQFRQALSTAGVELPAHQMELIYEKFDDSNDLSINYVAFTRAVDPAVSAAAEGGTLGPLAPVLAAGWRGGERPRVAACLLPPRAQRSPLTTPAAVARHFDAPRVCRRPTRTARPSRASASPTGTSSRASCCPPRSRPRASSAEQSRLHACRFYTAGAAAAQ